MGRAREYWTLLGSCVSIHIVLILIRQPLPQLFPSLPLVSSFGLQRIWIDRPNLGEGLFPSILNWPGLGFCDICTGMAE